ncbi:MAG: hypothetical protein ACRDT7_10400 [Microbacterium sp.]
MLWWLAALNTAAALVTAGFGVAALARPALFAPPGQTPGRFYPAMYAGRAIPLGIAVAIVVWLPAPDPLPTVLLLGVAALAQVADVATGTVTRQWGLVGGATFGAVCHAVGAVALLG